MTTNVEVDMFERIGKLGLAADAVVSAYDDMMTEGETYTASMRMVRKMEAWGEATRELKKVLEELKL